MPTTERSTTRWDWTPRPFIRRTSVSPPPGTAGCRTGTSSRALAEAAKQGVWRAGATPREFATVCDSPGADQRAPDLSIRELVADSIELTIRGHSYDGLVVIAPTADHDRRRPDGSRATRSAGRGAPVVRPADGTRRT